MSRKMMKEEKELRKYVDETKSILSNRVILDRVITALVRAVREDCIEIYYDWESRPRECAGITFPDAVRCNKRWRETAAIRRREGK